MTVKAITKVATFKCPHQFVVPITAVITESLKANGIAVIKKSEILGMVITTCTSQTKCTSIATITGEALNLKKDGEGVILETTVVNTNIGPMTITETQEVLKGS